MLRRLASAVVLLALISAPAVARERLFCRVTGATVEGCGEAPRPDPACSADLPDGCCLRELVRPPGAMRTPAREAGIAPPVSTPAAAPAPTALAALPAASADRPAAAGPPGPPLFVLHRALLL